MHIKNSSFFKKLPQVLKSVITQITYSSYADDNCLTRIPLTEQNLSGRGWTISTSS